jgi:predicted nucleic acid-binding Zn ribbon protein
MGDVMSSGAAVRRVPYPVRENHKHCAKCGKLVSKMAYACRRCGKRQRVRPRTILLGLSACLMVGMFAVATAGALAPRATEIYAAPGVTPGATPTEPKATVAVDAPALWLAYSHGSWEADRQFKDRPVLVTGTVRSVDRDFEGRMVVRLNTGDALETVNARMALRNDPAALAIVKGRSVSLACIGKGALIGAPLLGDCGVR